MTDVRPIRQTRTLTAPPDLARLYGRALLTARGRRGDTLPELELVLPDVVVEPDRLARYNRVCGFGPGETLPATYPHVLAFPLAVAVMVEPSFPLGLVGLVHVANRITQHRPVRLGERITFRVWAADLRPHDRGRQVDLVCEGQVGGELVWTERGTYLSRSRSGGPSRHSTGETAADEAAAGKAVRAEDARRAEPTAVWRVPGDVGRRYAAVSGDRNPIHLSTPSARLFGFRRAIAHGMWVKAAALAAVADRLPGGYAVDVRFKLPLLLPATAAFRVTPAASIPRSGIPAAGMSGTGTEGVGVPGDGGFDLEVRDLASGLPHLAGTVRPVTADPAGGADMATG